MEVPRGNLSVRERAQLFAANKAGAKASEGEEQTAKKDSAGPSNSAVLSPLSSSMSSSSIRALSASASGSSPVAQLRGEVEQKSPNRAQPSSVVESGGSVRKLKAAVASSPTSPVGSPASPPPSASASRASSPRGVNAEPQNVNNSRANAGVPRDETSVLQSDPDPLKATFRINSHVLFRKSLLSSAAQTTAVTEQQEQQPGQLQLSNDPTTTTTSTMIGTLLERSRRHGDAVSRTIAQERAAAVAAANNNTSSGSGGSISSETDWRWEVGKVVEIRGDPPKFTADLMKKNRRAGNDSVRDIPVQDTVDRRRIVVKSLDTVESATYELAISDVRPFSYTGLVAELHDAAQLPEVSDGALTYALKRRYATGLHYTYVGSMLVAANPYRFCRYPSDAPHPRHIAEKVKDYLHDRATASEQHSVLGADPADGQQQQQHSSTVPAPAPSQTACVVVTGESGAGKTETVKLVLTSLLSQNATASQESSADHASELLSKLDASNRILESFGNAKTSLNANSSRFTKCLSVFLDQETQRVVGAQLDCFLLEVSRVVSRNAGESMFHVFHMLMSDIGGLTLEERNAFDVWDPSLFRCFFSGAAASTGPAEADSGAGAGGSHRQGNPCPLPTKKLAGELVNTAPPYTLAQLRQSLTEMGATPAQIRSLWQILCGILHLLNVQFTADDEYSPASVTQASLGSCSKAAALLGFTGKPPASEASSPVFTVTRTSTNQTTVAPSSAAESSASAASPTTQDHAKGSAARSLEALLTTVALGNDVRRLHCGAAYATRDTLAKFLYEGAFAFVTAVINGSLDRESNGASSSDGNAPAQDQQANPSPASPVQGILTFPKTAAMDCSRVQQTRPVDVCIILDMFGFETLPRPATNSLEQLLINYTNEAIQTLYEETTFDALSRDLDSEGVRAAADDFEKRHKLLRMSAGSALMSTTPEGQNLSCYSLLIRRPNGILDTINDDSVLAQQKRTGGENLAAKLLAITANSSPALMKPNRLEMDRVWMNHYCGWVEYSLDSVSTRNRLSTSVSLMCLRSSSDPFVRQISEMLLLVLTGGSPADLLLDRTARSPTTRAVAALSEGSPLLGRSLASPRAAGSSARVAFPNRLHAARAAVLQPGSSHVRTPTSSVSPSSPTSPTQLPPPQTLIAAFRTQVDAVLTVLRESEVFWIRCIKPNALCSPTEFDDAMVEGQLRHGGVVRALMVSGEGYSHRYSHKEFVNRFLRFAVQGYSQGGEGDERKESSGGALLKAKRQLKDAFDVAVSHAAYRDACTIACRLIPCCMDDALLLGMSKVFATAETLRRLQALIQTEKVRLASLFQRLGRGNLDRRRVFGMHVEAEKAKRVAAIKKRVDQELPLRLRLEEERVLLLRETTEHRAEELAVLARRASHTSTRVMQAWERAVETIDSELQQAMREITTYEESRLNRERAIAEHRQQEEQYTQLAREAILKEKERRQRLEHKHHAELAIQRGRFSDVAAKRDEEEKQRDSLWQVLVKERREQQRVERRVESERRRMEREQAAAAAARETKQHLLKQRQRLEGRAQLREQINRRQQAALLELDRREQKRQQSTSTRPAISLPLAEDRRTDTVARLTFSPNHADGARTNINTVRSPSPALLTFAPHSTNTNSAARYSSTSRRALGNDDLSKWESEQRRWAAWEQVVNASESDHE